MSPMVMAREADTDVFDLDFQVSVAALSRSAAIGDAAPTVQCPGPSGTCWADSCAPCCAGSDWHTGC